MARLPPTQLKRDHDSAFVRWKGKRIYFGRWGKPETNRAFAKWLADVSGHPDAPAAKHLITVAACVARYLLYVDSYYPPGEAANVRVAVQSLHNFAGQDLAVDFGPKLLKDLQRALATATTADGKLKYARTTINARIDRMRRCFRWCASEELIPVEIVTALETVAGLKRGRGLARETEKVRAVSSEIVAKTLPFLSPTTSAMVQVQYLCGMRPQDVCGMTTGTIDRSGDIWIYRPASHKGSHRGQSLVKAIPKAAQTILMPFLRANPDEPLFSPLDTKQHFGNAGKKSRRGPYTTASYGKSILYGIAKAGKGGAKEKIPHWTPNQLRHSIATDLRRTVGIEAAAAYLGHAKSDTTLIYAEQTEQAIREIAMGIVSPHTTQIRPPVES